MDSYVSSLAFAQNAFNVPYFYMQITVMVTPLFGVFLGPLYAVLASRLNAQRVLFSCLLTLALGFCLTYFSNSYESFLISRIIQGIGSTGITFSTLAYIMESKDPRDLPLLSGIFTFVMPLSWCISPLLGSFLIHLYGFKSPFFALLILSVSCLMSFRFFTNKEKIIQPLSHFDASKFFRYFKDSDVLLSVVNALPLGIFCFLITINPILCVQIFDASLLEIACLQSFSAMIVIITTLYNYSQSGKGTKWNRKVSVLLYSLFVSLVLISFLSVRNNALICLILHNLLVGSLIGLVSYPALQVLTLKSKVNSRLEFSAFLGTARNSIIVLCMFLFAIIFNKNHNLFFNTLLLVYPILIACWGFILRRYNG